MTLDETIMLYEEGVSKESEQVAEWLKELKMIKDRGIVEMWVARDKANAIGVGQLFLYLKEPKRDEKFDMFFCPADGDMIELPNEALPEVTWKNSPRKVKLILED